MITKPAYRRLCTLTFSNSLFVGLRYSPRSDEKRLTSRDSVANSSFAYSSQLVNNRLVCKYVMRTEPIHIKKSVWLWGFRHVNFRSATRSFHSLSNHTHKLAHYRCSQYVLNYSWIQPLRFFMFNSFSSRTRRIWADIYNQRGRRPSWLLSAHIWQVREE